MGILVSLLAGADTQYVDPPGIEYKTLYNQVGAYSVEVEKHCIEKVIGFNKDGYISKVEYLFPWASFFVKVREPSSVEKVLIREFKKTAQAPNELVSLAKLLYGGNSSVIDPVIFEYNVGPEKAIASVYNYISGTGFGGATYVPVFKVETIHNNLFYRVEIGSSKKKKRTDNEDLIRVGRKILEHSTREFTFYDERLILESE